MFNPFKYLAWPFVKVYEFFRSEIGKKVLASVDELVPVAFEVVSELKHLDPKTMTAKEVMALYDKYAAVIPTLLTANKTSIGNALLNLATILVKRRKPGVSTTLIHAAIELVLANFKAQAQDAKQIPGEN